MLSKILSKKRKQKQKKKKRTQDRESRDFERVAGTARNSEQFGQKSHFRKNTILTDRSNRESRPRRILARSFHVHFCSTNLELVRTFRERNGTRVRSNISRKKREKIPIRFKHSPSSRVSPLERRCYCRLKSRAKY